MSKSRGIYICQECGSEFSKWFGRCTSCGSWNSIVEEVRTEEQTPPYGRLNFSQQSQITPQPICKISIDVEKRCSTGCSELDRVLGGGLVPGSLVLLGGSPGIGKSTLLLQIASHFASNIGTVLYVSGEESAGQLRVRGARLHALKEKLLVAAATDLNAIVDQIVSVQPALVIIDSIQTVFSPELHSTPGSISQVRECTLRLLQLANTLGIPVLITGHVTKEGSLAGPRVLEHMVDVVLYLEGERNHLFRILRGAKNRFGSTNEIGVFEMGERGLREVVNPSELFLSNRPTDAPGSVVIATVEGTRPFLVEVQALVSPTNFGVPRRSSTGIDYNRLLLLLAVLEKKMGLNFSKLDAYVNAVGGVRIEEPAADLGIVAALVSSFRGAPCPEATVVVGEVGLTGEVRAVSHIEQRIKEAGKLGFSRCIFPRGNVSNLTVEPRLKLLPVDSIGDVLNIL